MIHDEGEAAEEAAGRGRGLQAAQYWYIDYQHFIGVVKYGMHLMKVGTLLLVLDEGGCGAHELLLGPQRKLRRDEQELTEARSALYECEDCSKQVRMARAADGCVCEALMCHAVHRRGRRHPAALGVQNPSVQ